jgi:hypothetical protein
VPTFSNIDGQEPSTVTFKLATVALTRNSTVMQQEIMSLGDPDTTNAIAAVLNTTPASTAWALAVRDVVPNSTTVAVSTIQGAVTVRSSAANALVSVYQSSAAELNVTVAGYVAPSTTISISTVQGAVNMRSSAANALVTVYQSTAADLNVTVAGYSTIAAVSSVGGRVGTMPFSTVWASSAGFHFDSSGALQIAGTISATAGSTVSTGFISVRISDGSTWVVDYLNASTFTNASVGGGVNFLRAGQSSVSSTDLFVIPWGSTQGAQYFIPVTDSGVSVIDSTNRAINVNVVAGAAGGSTIMTVSTVQGAVIVRSSAANALISVYQSTASELQVTATPAAGSTWRSQPGSTLWASSAGFHFDSSGALQVAASFTGSTGPLTVSQLLDSSGGSVSAADSANNAIRVNVVAGAAGGSTIVTVSAFGAGLISSAVQAGGSSALTVRNVWSSTNADQPVSAAQSGTWNIGTVTTVSSLAGAVITRSSKADALVTVYQSSAADLNVTVAGYSTIVAVSSLAGAVICRSSKADALVTVYQSTATDLLATVSQGGTWNINSVSGLQSSVAPSSGSSGLVVRQVIDGVDSFASTSALATTSVAVQSSGAAIRIYVTAYSITTTNQTAAQWGFFSSNGTLLWPMTLAALSSGVAGVNLAVSPPGYLFRTAASDALNFKTNGSTVASVQLGVSYYRAP